MGNITREIIRDAKFVVLDSGNEAAIRVTLSAYNVGEVDLNLYMRWHYQDGFTGVGFKTLEYDGPSAVESFLRSGGVWDASWQALKDGGSYVSTRDGQTYVAGYAVVERFGDWTAVNTTKACEVAAEGSWWRGQEIPGMQAYCDAIFVGIVTPDPPAPLPTPQEQFDPNKIGLIAVPAGLYLAEATRITLTKDPANGERPLVGSGNIPV